MKKSIQLFTFLFLHIIGYQSVAQSPLLKGKIKISVQQGTVECDFILTDIPKIPDYAILLNAGMNLLSISNTQNAYTYSYERENKFGYENFGYFIPDNTGKAKYIPGSLRFQYVGKFPVARDTLNCQSEDWRGNIAFNGYSIRADGVQSAWYPIFYDIKKDKEYDKVRCDIEIECADCRSIYLNGNEPAIGKTAHFKNDKAFELLLYAGDFDVHHYKETYFINSLLTKNQMIEFDEIADGFKKYYEEKLGIEFNSAVSYLSATPSSKSNAWSFVSFPTIASIGWESGKIKNLLEDSWLKETLPHEFAHYYFGTYLECSSELGAVFNEGLAEFISMKLMKDLYSDSLFQSEIKEKAKKLKSFSPRPFSSITIDSGFVNRELYVYNYAPLLFTAIEKEIGERMMWKWLHTILTTPTTFTNYTFLKETLAATLNDNQRFNVLDKKYFSDTKSLNNIYTTLAIE